MNEMVDLIVSEAARELMEKEKRINRKKKSEEVKRLWWSRHTVEMTDCSDR